MTTGDTQNSGTKERPKFEQEFKELPLEDKLGSLFRMEAAALEETLKCVADGAVIAFKKAGEVLDEFGDKVSTEFNKARTQAASEPAAAEPTASGAKPKGAKKKNSEPDVNG